MHGTAPLNLTTNPNRLPWQAWVADYIVTYHRTEAAARSACKRHARDYQRNHGGGKPGWAVRPVATA